MQAMLQKRSTLQILKRMLCHRLQGASCSRVEMQQRSTPFWLRYSVKSAYLGDEPTFMPHSVMQASKGCGLHRESMKIRSKSARHSHGKTSIY
jgi:hypothetical protein